MKKIPIDLLMHYKQEEQTTTQCVRLELRNGERMGFTSFDKDIVFEEEPDLVYKAFTGMTPTAIQSSSQFNVDNLEIEGFIDDDRIKESDLLLGKYDYSKIMIFEFNYNDKPYMFNKVNIKREGLIGEIRLNGETFFAEIRGKMVKLQNKIGPLFQPTCRADFTDSKCKVNKAPYVEIGSVVSVDNNTIIKTSLSKPVNYFNNGKITFTSGLNIGLSYEVKQWDGQYIHLQLQANYEIGVGDSFEVLKGCDKTINTCSSVFGNAVNFRGEPFIPTTSQIINR